MKPVVKYKLAGYRRDRIPLFDIRLENTQFTISERVEGLKQAVIRANILCRQYDCRCEIDR